MRLWEKGELTTTATPVSPHIRVSLALVRRCCGHCPGALSSELRHSLLCVAYTGIRGCARCDTRRSVHPRRRNSIVWPSTSAAAMDESQVVNLLTQFCSLLVNLLIDCGNLDYTALEFILTVGNNGSVTNTFCFKLNFVSHNTARYYDFRCTLSPHCKRSYCTCDNHIRSTDVGLWYSL